MIGFILLSLEVEVEAEVELGRFQGILGEGPNGDDNMLSTPPQFPLPSTLHNISTDRTLIQRHHDAASAGLVSTDVTIHATCCRRRGRYSVPTFACAIFSFRPGTHEPGSCLSVQASTPSSKGPPIAVRSRSPTAATPHTIIWGTCRYIAVREQLADSHLLSLEPFLQTKRIS